MSEPIVVSFSVASGSELHPDTPLFVRDDAGKVIGELSPVTSVNCKLPRNRPYFRFGTPFSSTRFKLKPHFQSAEMHWDGSRWHCANAVNVNKSFSKNASADDNSDLSSPLQIVGAIGIVIGLTWAILAFNFDVTVATYEWGVGATRIVNVDLLQRRNLHFMSAGIVLICSLLTTFFAISQRGKR